ncbi:PH domain-containing protein [Streptomyces sp. NPDC052415]|uniref:PH domain-containing protein n=1 Tax=unclassified Streptomyces TaxID=2593676 RepID=UPI0020215866|nr:PH domain-containing protein [Streptomyces sp. YS415]MCL7429078.1 PH domain-containing protein [Streptomyces sp. YS415]
MTTPDRPSSVPQPPVPPARDRVYRSPMGMTGGALLLAIALWLGIDALVQGSGRTPWLALASLLLIVPVVTAFTLRPAVFANEDRLRIRNPFRVVVLPWGQVVSLRSGYSNEVVDESGTKYQLWAIPVSLRDRKKAARRTARAEAERNGQRPRRGGLGLGFGGFGGGAEVDGPVRAETDKVMDELRELLATREKAESAQGEVTVRWAYEVLGPFAAGLVLLVVVLLVG